MTSKLRLIITALILVMLPVMGFSQNSPAPITGSTSDFLLYTSAGDITNAGINSTYSGSVGTNAGTLSGFGALLTQPTNLYVATPETAECALDLNALYSDLVARTGTTRVGVYGSESLMPGVYSTAGAITIATDLILDGGGDLNAQFIIKTGGAFTMAATSKILLTNGAQAKNVYWVIAGAAAIAANCEARGMFICHAGAISIGANVTMQGSALTLAGAITTSEGMKLASAANTMVLLANQTIPIGAIPADLIVTGNSSPIIKWQSATNSAFTNPTDILHYSTLLSGCCMGVLSTTTYYRALILVDGVIIYSNSIAITIDTPPNMGAAGPFMLFTSAGAVTNTGTVSFLGGIGTHAGAISGFTNPSDPLLQTANAFTLATKNYLPGFFNFIKAKATTATHAAAFGAGETLLPGVYAVNSAATIGGILTLDGQNNPNAVFILKITGALALAAATEVKLINAASTDNVFWVIDGAIAIGANSILSGTFICEAGAIAIGANSLIHGRIFTIAGAITLENSSFTYETNTTAVIGTSGNQVLNYGAEPENITITNATEPIVRWEKSSDFVFSNPITIANATTTVSGSEIGSITVLTYIRAVFSSGTGTTYSPVVTLSLSGISIAGTLNADQLICENAVPNDLILTGSNGFVKKWQRSATADFLVPTDITSNDTTLAGMTIGAINATTYFRAVVQNCTCPDVYSNTLVISIDFSNLGGSITSDQIFCAPAQPTTLILSGNDGVVMKWQSSLTSDFLIAVDIPNTTSELTSEEMGIVSTTTFFRAVSQNCNLPVAYATPAVITIATTTTWNGVSWSNGYPSLSNAAIFEADYTTTADIESCSFTFNAGVAVIVDSGHNVTLGSALIVSPSARFTLNDNANLLQPEGVINTGIITVKRNSAPLYRLDFTLWSSPVTGQNLKSFSPATVSNRFYFYDPTASVNGAYATVFKNSLFPGPTESSYTFETAKGYLIRSPNNFASYIPPVLPATESAVAGVSYQGQFTGTPNNGALNNSLSTALNGYNLVGNPYPSAITLADFLDTNSTTIDGTIWLWRKINNLSSGIGYATLTNAGLTSIQPDVAEGSSGGKIGIGQGFFVKTRTGLTNANIIFDNAMRSANTSHLFFKNQSTFVSEKHRIWLNLSNATQTIGQNLIGYITGATNGVDYSFEGKSFGDDAISLSSLIDDNEYNIQARSLPFQSTDVVPLNFKTDISNTYTISIDRVDGLFETNQDIFLKDNLTGNLQNLKLAAYSFHSQAGNFTTRFEIRYQNQFQKGSLVFDANAIMIYKKEGALHINSGNLIMNKIEIYDTTGRLLFTKANVNAATESITHLSNDNQVLIIKIKSLESGVITKKIIY
jgi:hypothetical protein